MKVKLLVCLALLIAVLGIRFLTPRPPLSVIQYPPGKLRLEVRDNSVSAYYTDADSQPQVWKSEDYIVKIDKAFVFDYDGSGNLALVVLYWRYGDYFAERDYLQPIRGDHQLSQHINIYTLSPYPYLVWGGSTMRTPLVSLNICADDFNQLCGQESTYDSFPAPTRDVRLTWAGWSWEVNALDSLPEFLPNQYLVAVSALDHPAQTYALEDLLAGQLVTITENVSLIPTVFTPNLTIVPLSELPEALGQGAVALLTPDQVRAEYKTLTLNGQYIWAKDFDPLKYPLKKYVHASTSNLPQDTISIYANGEISTARDVANAAVDKYQNYAYIYDHFRPYIQQADIAIGLLEAVLSGNKSSCIDCLSLIGSEQTSGGLNSAGYDIVALGANHAGDDGQKGYTSTLNALSSAGIQTAGTGDNEEEVRRPAIMHVGEVTVGLISADDVNAEYWFATDGNYGTNHFSKIGADGQQLDPETLSYLEEAKREYGIDVLILYMSWGMEYSHEVVPYQRELAHNLIDAGADIVLGTHPHVVQPAEFYNGKPIFYSLGNFVFDQTDRLPTRQGVAVELYLQNTSLKAIRLLPYQLCSAWQTSNDLTLAYLLGGIALTDLLQVPESEGCVYYQPYHVPEGEISRQILKHVWGE